MASHVNFAPALAPGGYNANNPPCPDHLDGTNDHLVRIFSGAGHVTCYTCSCSKTWTQKKPELLQPGETAEIKITSRAALTGGPMRTADGNGYKCVRCHQIKKGHTCTNPDPEKPAKRGRRSPAEAPPPSGIDPNLQAQLSDLISMSPERSDSEVLAFLRKWDLKPSEADALYKSLLQYQEEQAVPGTDITEMEPLSAAPMPLGPQVPAQPAPEPPTDPAADIVSSLIDALSPADTAATLTSAADAAVNDPPPFMRSPSPVPSLGEPTLNMGEPTLGELMDIKTCGGCNALITDDDDTTSCTCGNTHRHRLCLAFCGICG